MTLHNVALCLLSDQHTICVQEAAIYHNKISALGDTEVDNISKTEYNDTCSSLSITKQKYMLYLNSYIYSTKTRYRTFSYSEMLFCLCAFQINWIGIYMKVTEFIFFNKLTGTQYLIKKIQFTWRAMISQGAYIIWCK